MLEIFDVRYDELTDIRSEDLYKLRKKTFKDRLKLGGELQQRHGV